MTQDVVVIGILGAIVSLVYWLYGRGWRAPKPPAVYPLVYHGMRGPTGRRGGWYDQRGRPWGDIRGVDFQRVDWASYASVHGCPATANAVLTHIERQHYQRAYQSINFEVVTPPHKEEIPPPPAPPEPPAASSWDVLTGDDPFG